LRRYDGPRTFFYLDPPYWGYEDDYGKAMFARQDFDRMAAQLETMKGTFLLSINDVPQIREAFAAFTISPVRTTYSITKSAGSPAAELLISNTKL
jgi:DNA adenine methylase